MATAAVILPNGSALARARADLGVRVGASVDEIREAYKRKVLKAHPDKGGSPEAFHQIQRAQELLVTAVRLSPRTVGATRASRQKKRATVKRRQDGPRERKRQRGPDRLATVFTHDEESSTLNAAFRPQRQRDQLENILEVWRHAALAVADFGGFFPAAAPASGGCGLLAPATSEGHLASRKRVLWPEQVTRLGEAGHPWSDGGRPQPRRAFFLQAVKEARTRLGKKQGKKSAKKVHVERKNSAKRVHVVPKRRSDKGHSGVAANVRPDSPFIEEREVRSSRIDTSGDNSDVASSGAPTGRGAAAVTTRNIPPSGVVPSTSLSALLARLRALPPDRRRAALVGLPTETRTALGRFMAMTSLDGSAQPTQLRAPQASTFGVSDSQAPSSSPDLAALANELKALGSEERRRRLQAIPAATRIELQAYVLAQKDSARQGATTAEAQTQSASTESRAAVPAASC
eukprot:TRINITY_DN10112_c0_g1_i1.p1 TRINITY_DN10112_c0_g1~~TRINITY_DN10112_c0_g1_i1.p1  ORF type:complete len:460 (-),score=65.74 TRINITY_DN10112_c0_g1_i1:66-1445(-)